MEVTQVIRLDEISRQGPRGAAARQQSLRDDLRLSHLLRLTEVAASVRSVEPLFEAIIQSLQIALPADLVIPFLLDPDGVLRPYLAQRHGFLDGATTLGIDQSLLQRCLQEGPLAADRGRSGSTTIACVPMRTGVNNRGLIYCERHDGQHAFGDEDLRYLFSVALGTALALDSLRTYDLLARRSDSLARQLEEQYNMAGESAAMQEVFRLIRKVAPSDAGVLICGPSGTGKEMVAHAIHNNSRRSEGPMEIVNSAAVPPTLLESELFGHVRGAFTGAVADKPGRFELADGGTLFLDEVAELPLECQAKLLRAIEEGRIRRVGRHPQPPRGRAPDRRHQPRPRRRPRPRAPCGWTCSTAWTACASSCRACASATATSSCWPATSCTSSASRSSTPSTTSRRRRWRCSAPTSGPATCASCATWWSAWSSWRTPPCWGRTCCRASCGRPSPKGPSARRVPRRGRAGPHSRASWPPSTATRRGPPRSSASTAAPSTPRSGSTT